MAGMTERNRQKIELAGRGYSTSYINDWSAKTTLYRHKPSYNQNGEVVAEIGTTVSGVPGNPDYVLRKSKIGLFAWAPSDQCKCKWCGERVEEPVSSVSSKQEESTVEEVVKESSYFARGRKQESGSLS